MKKIISLTVAVTFFLLSNAITAQQLTPPQQQAVNKLFKTSNVVYFKFKVHSLSEVPQFAKILSVDKSDGGNVSAHANKAQFTQFIKMNYAYTVASNPAAKKKTTKAAPAKAKKSTVKKK
ncbi:MAG: hypothetical protein ACXVPU_00110 [Bacteroidia bacterium]